MNSNIYLAFGSNLGDRADNFRLAALALQQNPDIQILRFSPVYETLPVGPGKQGNYWNAVIEMQTDQPPSQLLRVCLDVEKKLGRQRSERWAARIIDIDVLLYKNTVCATNKLHIPHPELCRRSFVLRPLADLSPNLMIHNQTVVQWLKDSKDGVLKEISFEWPCTHHI